MTQRLPVVVLISGRGSNMRVLAERAAAGELAIDVRAVLSDKADASGLQVARELDIATETLASRSFADREAFDAALADRIESRAPKLVVLAGYMRILSPAFVRRFMGRLVNIHPSLLPKYPGLHTHERVLQAGDAVHGATVHFVTNDLDAGPPIIQARVPVMPGDTLDSLSARVQRAEHIIYPLAVEWFADGRVQMCENQTWMDGKPCTTPPIVEVNV
jgi:phosphoribosylglycinamide formyltransferase 1